MSYLLTTGGVDDMIYSDPDDRNYDKFPWTVHQVATTEWQQWPSRSGLVGDPTVPLFIPKWEETEYYSVWSGEQSGLVISGITKDATGAALGGVTVKAYRTSALDTLPADLQEGPTVVSAADGAYSIPLPNADAHYCVGYKAGAPDVAGTTLNTLIGV